MAQGTRATKFLERAGVPFSIHTYGFDAEAASIGLHAAEALDEDPARVLKSLMVLVDGKPACAIVPADRTLSMKRLAAELGGKSAQLMPAADAERVSGYKIGGVSPFGQTRQLPVVIEQSALAQEFVYINGGQRGLQVRLDPAAAARVLGALAASVTAGRR